MKKLSKQPPTWMQHIHKFPKGGVTGARSSEYCDGGDLSAEAWGDAAQDKNSDLCAFAYLWRRFGPPWFGTDPHKRMAQYFLGTPRKDVWLSIDAGASGLYLACGYMVSKKLEAEIQRPQSEWWKSLERWWCKTRWPEGMSREEAGKLYGEELCGYGNKKFWRDAEKAIGKNPRMKINPRNWRKSPPLVREVNRAILVAMRELLRPVYVRDCPINIFGRCEDSDSVADRSPYAGLGVPKPAMDRLAKDDGE